MAKYTRMIVMSMSNEEIAEVLEKEGESLPDYTVYMMVEELKRRKEHPEEQDAELEQDEEEAFEESYEGSLEEEDSVEMEEGEELDLEELQAGITDEAYEDLSDEERAEKARLAIEMEQESRKKTLIMALVATGVTALAIVGFVIYVVLSGQI